MRQAARTAVVSGGTVMALAAGGGISAWAAWQANAEVATVRTTVSRVPTAGKPEVEKSGNNPKVSWEAPEGAPDRPFDGFIVVRRNGTVAQTACTIMAPAHACSDKTAPAGATVTYVVRATMGPTWFGTESEPSEPFAVPGGPKPKAPAEISAVSEVDRTVAPTPSEKATRSSEPTPAAPAATPSSSPTPTANATSETPAPEPPLATESGDTDLAG